VVTKIQCRIGSDSDHLSRLQLQEVVDALTKHCPKMVISTVEPGDDDVLSNIKGGPNSPSRIAYLLKNLIHMQYDVLVVNAAYVPPTLPAGVSIGAITDRLTPYDVIISKDDEIFDELPKEASVLANDVRRESQLLYYRPDLILVKSRGSVDSLIQKVKNAKYDAVILSAADVERLKKQDFVAEVFTNSICVPAAGQGSLAVLIRSEDNQMEKCAATINNEASLSELRAEWSFMNALSLSESDPVGVLGSIEGKKIELEGVLALPDGTEKIRSVVHGAAGKEEELGQLLAGEILEAGGREILQELNLL
jgi:hydroxymethylbilane synthase